MLLNQTYICEIVQKFYMLVCFLYITYFSRRTLGPCDIFTTQNPNLVPRKVLMEGCSGVGKSLWCHYLAYMWAQGNHEDLKKYKLLFILDQRECTGNLEEDIIIQNFSTHYRGTSETIGNILEKHSDEVLFIIDDFEYDENRDDIFADMAIGKMYKSSSVIVTTNSSYITPKLASYFNTRYIILGMVAGQQTTLINHYTQLSETDNDVYYNLKSLVTDRNNLVGSTLSRKPLICLCLCLLCESKYTIDWDNETSLLVEWLQCIQDIHPLQTPESTNSIDDILISYKTKENEDEKENNEDEEFSAKEINLVNNAVMFLCDQALTMSLHGTNHIVLDKEVDKNVLLILPELGLTKPLLHQVNDNNKDVFTFVHRGYQDILAAQRLAQMNEESAKDIISKMIGEYPFHNVLKHFCGLMKEQPTSQTMQHLFMEFADINSEIWKELPYVEAADNTNPLEMFLKREGTLSKFQLCLECLNECDGKSNFRQTIVDTFPSTLLLRQQSNPTPGMISGLAFLLHESATTITHLDIKLDQFAIYHLHAFQKLADSLSRNTSIQSIKLLWSDETILSEFMVRVFRNNMNITEVICVADMLKCSTSISPIVWEDLRLACHNMDHVEVFELAKCSDATLVTHLVRNIPYTIRSLWVYKCHCDIIALQEISNRMSKSGSLLELSLQESKFFYADFKHIAIGIRQCLALKIFNLSYINFNQNNFIEICQALKFNDTLLVLNLSGSTLKEDACKEMASALNMNKIICEIILYNTEITRENIEIIQRQKNANVTLPGAKLYKVASVEKSDNTSYRSDSITSNNRHDSRKHSIYKPSSRRSSVGYQTSTYYYYSK